MGKKGLTAEAAQQVEDADAKQSRKSKVRGKGHGRGSGSAKAEGSKAEGKAEPRPEKHQAADRVLKPPKEKPKLGFQGRCVFNPEGEVHGTTSRR